MVSIHTSGFQGQMFAFKSESSHMRDTAFLRPTLRFALTENAAFLNTENAAFCAYIKCCLLRLQKMLRFALPENDAFSSQRKHCVF
jgi:hypothetical protein